MKRVSFKNCHSPLYISRTVVSGFLKISNLSVINVLAVIVFFLLINACKYKPLPSPEVLLEADREFSTYSDNNGYKKAFVTFAHDQAVLLRPNSYPILGIDTITAMNKGNTPEGYKLVWEPFFGAIAHSGEMGYTYGTYTFTTPDTVLYGTYVTIWQRDEAGNWKYVLDSGNEGLQP